MVVPELVRRDEVVAEEGLDTTLKLSARKNY